MDCFDYVKGISEKIGETKSADRIIKESWCVVMDAIRRLSKDRAIELAKELVGPGAVMVWDKGPYKLGLDEAPSTRLLAVMPVIAPFVGRIMFQKHGDDPKKELSSSDCFKRIREAYDWGVKSTTDKPTL